jgi:hypothetical protein
LQRLELRRLCESGGSHNEGENENGDFTHDSSPWKLKSEKLTALLAQGQRGDWMAFRTTEI